MEEKSSPVPSPTALRLVERLRAERKRLGLSQEELGRRAGLAQSHVSRIESGDLAPSFETLERVAEALGSHLVVSVDRTVVDDGRPSCELYGHVFARGQCLNCDVSYDDFVFRFEDERR